MYSYENDLLKEGHLYIAGCDEVGRGPLAGPVVAAAVILNPDIFIEGLNDSKKLTEKKRAILDIEIRELEGEMGDRQVVLQARLMSQALRKLTGAVSRSKCTVIFINQIRMKIGVMFGNPETTTGGRALKFYASQRLDVRRIASIKDGEDVVGSRTRVKVVKNKIAPPFKKCEFDIMHGEGISRTGELIDLGLEKDLVTRRGTWYSIEGTQIGQGRENARKYLKANPEAADDLEYKLRKAYGMISADEGKVKLGDKPKVEERS